MKLGESKKLPDHFRCVDCGETIDGATCVDGDAYPSPGDVTVCIFCGHLMVFSDDLTPRNPTDAEIRMMAGDKRILAVQRARGEAKMSLYNPAILRLNMPMRFFKLRIDERGFPVPSFVRWIDGKPDFRLIDEKFFVRAVANKLCWLCGEKLGRHQAFVIGPMCSINRISSEPPSHLDCARFACKACPFLTQPKRKRNEHGLPEEKTVAGVMIERNPGVSLIWVTDTYNKIRDSSGLLFKLGDATKLEWYAHGRKATRAEIMESIETGLPLLRDQAEREGPDAVAALVQMTTRGLALVPAE